MSLIVESLEDGGLRVTYGERRNKTIAISPSLVRKIHEASGSLPEAEMADLTGKQKDAIIRKVYQDQRVKHDVKLREQLAVYARAVMKMPPGDLSHVTIGIPAGHDSHFYCISLEVGRHNRLVGASL